MEVYDENNKKTNEEWKFLFRDRFFCDGDSLL